MRTLVLGWLIGALIVVALEPRIGREVAVRHPATRAEWAATANSRSRSAAGSTGPAPLFQAATPIETGALVIPVAGVERSALVDTYEAPRGLGRPHHALDIMAPYGTPVLAAVDGTVRKLFTSRDGGLTIYQFDMKSERIYYYAHLDRYAGGLAEGVAIAQGSVIGYVGSSGNATTPHLHFAIENLPPTKEWWKGTPVDPYPLLQASGVTVPLSAVPPERSTY
jgi:murein DD-endopeptidase MepM/ murein hydrolase activator NlpD